MRISDWSSDVCSSDLVVEIGAGSLRDAHGDVKTPVALVHKPRFTPAEPCRNRIRNVADGETEARDRGAVEFHIERWRATDLFGLDAGRTGYGLEYSHHLICRQRHLVEIRSAQRLVGNKCVST